MPNHRPVMAAVAFHAARALAQAQTSGPPPVPTLHAEARVVQIDVVVTDSQNKPVVDLTKRDFSITDNGKSRAIDIFSVNQRRGAIRAKSASPAATAIAAPPW